MRFLSWLEAVRVRFTERETSTRRRAARSPVAGQLEQLEGKSLLSVSALFVNGELNVFSDSNDDITVGSAGSGAATTVQVLANGNPVTSVGSVLTSSVTSFVIQGGNLENTIDLSAVSSANYPNLAAINLDAGHGSDTILGSNGIAETLLGNHGDDVITCLDGASSINGNDGNDTIIGGGGNDSINGEDGDDSIDGGDGDDVIIGHDGNDTIDSGAGNDDVTGGDGDDLIAGGAGLDTLNGMMGADSIDGGDGNDMVYGGTGADSLSGSLGDDSLLANEGSDTLQGGDGNDLLDGGEDADTIQGETGNDSLNGGGGNDSLQGGDGDDSILGGAGKDTLEGNAGSDTVRGQSGNDTLFGGDGADLIDGGAGNDLENAGEVPTAPPPPQPLPARLFAIPTANRLPNVIVELDPVTGAELNRFASPEPVSANGDGLAFDGTTLFFINGLGTHTLYQLDPNTGAILNSDVIPQPGNERYDGLAVLNGLIYIEDSNNDDVLVYDPALGGVSTVLDINGVNGVANLVGGLAAATGPDRLIATIANGRTVVEINPLTGLITSSFTPTTAQAGSYSGVAVLEDQIYLGSSRVSGSTSLSVTTLLDVFDRSGNLLSSLTLPYTVAELGADDVGVIGFVPPPPTPTLPPVISNDTLLGGSGDDTLLAGDGNDLLNGGIGNDLLEGGDGNDSMVGAAGDDSILGQGGNDTLRGGAGTDTVDGGDGDDSIIASLGDGVDSIIGGEGSDSFQFFGSNVANTFNVGQAAGLLTISIDTTTQSIGSDIELVQVSSLGGTDRINVADLAGVGATEVRLNLGTGNDRMIAAAGAKLGSVQLRVFGEAGNDSLFGTDSAEFMSGGDGNDTLIGNDGDDTLNGDAGDDSIDGGAGSDVIDGGTGLSTIDGGDGDDSLTGSLFNDVINGGDGNDTIVGIYGNDLLNGGDG